MSRLEKGDFFLSTRLRVVVRIIVSIYYDSEFNKSLPSRQEGRTRVRDFTAVCVYNHQRANAVCQFSRHGIDGCIRPLGRKNVVRRDEWPPETVIDKKNGWWSGVLNVVNFHATLKKNILVYREKERNVVIFNPAAAVKKRSHDRTHARTHAFTHTNTYTQTSRTRTS